MLFTSAYSHPLLGRRMSSAVRLAVAVMWLASVGACSDDESPSPADSCGFACTTSVADCVDTPTTEAACSTACQAGYSVVPACGAPYLEVLECVGARPFVECSTQSITVSLAIADCTDELASYLSCLGDQVLRTCLAAPLGDDQCAAAGMSPHAFLCVGETPAGCSLYEGTSRANGVGTFCCP